MKKLQILMYLYFPFCTDISVHITFFLPTSAMYTHTHTDWDEPRDKDSEIKWILQNIQVGKRPSVRQLQSEPADWLTEGQTGRVQFPQVAPWSGQQVTPTPPAAHLVLLKFFVQRKRFWFQTALILRVQMDDECSLFCSLVAQSDGQVLNV